MGTCLPRTRPTDRVNVAVVSSGKYMLTCFTNGSSLIYHRVGAGYVRVILDFIIIAGHFLDTNTFSRGRSSLAHFQCFANSWQHNR